MNAPFDYRIKRQKRKTMALHILDNADVELRAPKWVSQKELTSFVVRNTEWILQQRALRLQQLQQQPAFVHGEKHPYLGDWLTLSTVTGQRDYYALCGAELQIGVTDSSDAAQVKKIVERFYRDQAKKQLATRVAVLLDHFALCNLQSALIPTVKYRRMRRRWGSCNQRGQITLNTQLVKLPWECIDYVIAHEICHLWHLNHSAEFYGLLTVVMPDWQQREQSIDRISRTSMA